MYGATATDGRTSPVTATQVSQKRDQVGDGTTRSDASGGVGVSEGSSQNDGEPKSAGFKVAQHHPVPESGVLRGSEQSPVVKVKVRPPAPEIVGLRAGDKHSVSKGSEGKTISSIPILLGDVNSTQPRINRRRPVSTTVAPLRNATIPSILLKDSSAITEPGEQSLRPDQGAKTALEDHTYLKGFLRNSETTSSTESLPSAKQATTATSRPPRGSFDYATAGALEPASTAGPVKQDATSPSYMQALPSTTIPTIIPLTDPDMQRILFEESATPSTAPFAASSVQPPSAALPQSPHTSSSTTSVTSSSTVSSASSTAADATTHRETTVEEVPTPRFPPADKLAEVEVKQKEEDEEEEEKEDSGPIYLVSLLFALPVVAVALWYLKKNHPDVQQLVPERLKSMLAQETSDGAHDNFYPVVVDEAADKISTAQVLDTLARRRRWEHPRATLRLQSILGEGHFGQVWRSEVDNIAGHQGTLLVAVKNVKENATPKEKQDLLRELRIMQDLGSHPHVVTLLGCCTEEDPVLVIMEYMVFGKLLTYLRENRGRHNYYNFSHDSAVLTSPDLTLFACQVATGMEYISNKGIMHRDLAARNILVDHTKVCKVSDFGMSRSARDLTTEVFEQKHRGALPIRWMSPESLYHNTFDQKTDCWSFGILLWEIITLGSTPYPGLSAREVMRSVREGYRLERPDHCHPQLYQLANSCWTAERNWRPTFSELRNELEVLLEDQNQGYVDLDRFQEEIYGTLNKSSDEKV